MPSARQQMATTEPTPSVDGWRRWTANGAVVTAVALGLRQALHEPEEVPHVVVDAPGQPLRPPQPLELHFDPAGPAHTWVVVRPWLFEAGP
jgi:hypothetical protein